MNKAGAEQSRDALAAALNVIGGSGYELRLGRLDELPTKLTVDDTPSLPGTRTLELEAVHWVGDTLVRLFTSYNAGTTRENRYGSGALVQSFTHQGAGIVRLIPVGHLP